MRLTLCAEIAAVTWLWYACDVVVRCSLHRSFASISLVMFLPKKPVVMKSLSGSDALRDCESGVLCQMDAFWTRPAV